MCSLWLSLALYTLVSSLRLLPGQPGDLAKLLCPSGLEARLVVPVPLRVVLAVDGSEMGS